MALPENNITTDSVAQTLGVNAHDIGTLCISDNINKWSKYKPVRLNKVSAIGDANWYKGEDGNCGYEIPLMKYAEESSIKSWTYLKPTNYYRLDDFAGYDHTNRQPPIIAERGDYIIDMSEQDFRVNFRFNINYNNGDIPNRFKISDFSNSVIYSMYPAIVIVGTHENSSPLGPYLYSSDKTVREYKDNDTTMLFTITDVDFFREFMFKPEARIYYLFTETGGLNGDEWAGYHGKKIGLPSATEPSTLNVVNGKFKMTTKYFYPIYVTDINDMDIFPILEGNTDQANQMRGTATFWLELIFRSNTSAYFNPSEFEIEYINLREEVVRHDLLGYIYINGTTSTVRDYTYLVDAESSGGWIDNFNVKLDMGTTNHSQPYPRIHSYITFYYVPDKNDSSRTTEIGSTGPIIIQEF